MQKRHASHFIAASLCALVAAACASIGAPDGGWYDETPPKVVKCQPANMSVNNRDKKLTLTFDEFIVLENASEKVVISPPQKEQPEIRVAGKKIHINLADTLLENTTYTVDFADAIVDNNEGNPMGNFTFAFSTGSEIDTMEVSGTVLEAENLEPIKGMLVGLHADLADTAFTTRGFDRVSRTDSRGRFTIKGVARGKYRIYALQDVDANFKFSQKAEKLAFDTLVVEPTCAPDFRQDTVWNDSTHIDTIKSIPFTHFYPDDIVLRAFTESFVDRHLLKAERPIPDQFGIYFTGPSDSLPVLRGLNFSGVEHFVVEALARKDTLTYWVTDTLVSNLDTLAFSMTYQETDTLGRLVSRTDTLELVSKITRSRQKKLLQEKIDEWEAEQKKERRRQKENYVEKPNPFLREDLSYKILPTGIIAPMENIRFTFDEPVRSIDSAALHFTKYHEADSVWADEPYLLVPVEGDLRSFTLYAEWRPGEKYRFEADSNAVVSILGKLSMPIKKEISVGKEDDFSALFVQLILPDTGAVVQLLDKSDKVVRSQRAVDNRTDFFYVKPGEYYLRLFIDRDGDGVWTTGEYASGTQPEEVFYFPKPMLLRARWEVEQDWNVRSIPLNKQKAEEITKQKPDAERKIKQRNAERARERNR